MIKVAIIGGNVGGGTLLSFLREEPEIHVSAMVETSENAPGAVLAKKWGIPVLQEVDLLKRYNPDLIINMTEDRELSERLRTELGAEVIGPVAARYFLLTGGRYKSIKSDFSEWTGIIKETEALLRSLAEIPPERSFGRIIESLTVLLKASAGLILSSEDSSVKVLASSGLSKRFLENNISILRQLFKDVFEKSEWLRIGNLKEEPEFSDYFLKEDIRSLIAVPVPVQKGQAVLSVMDRRQRDFGERENLILSIISSFTSIILSKGIIHEAGDVEKKIEELQRMNVELERLNHLKSRFLANMSHELRTPLNTILGFSEVLLEKTRGGLTPEQERYIRNIQNAGKYLLELVNNVLDLSKIESGKYDMVYETFSLKQMADEVIRTVEPLASRKNIKIHLNIQDGIGDITADKIKLKQILYNLLNNAIKFTPEAGRIGLVITKDKNRPGKYGSLPPDAEVIVCSVWDTGIGIKPEDQARIFDEFEQADSSLSRQAGGAGLGLALTKRFVELHGGEITVESSPGKGSTFTFFIPASVPEAKEAVLEVETAGIDYSISKEDAPQILLIEDDLATVELLTLHLSQAGYRVSHAYDGIEGIEKAKALRPFAIILDIMIPKKDGWEVLQELKASEETSSIPVIIHSIVDNRELAFTLGAADYLLKPLDKEALLSRLEELALSMQRERIPKSVLIIDSDPTTVAELTEMFLSGGFQIHEARDGKSGLELASAVRPSMILIGIELPDISGFDMVRQLRENPVTKDIPLFLLTQKDIPVEERLEIVGKIERIIKKHTYEPKDLISHIQELEMLYPRKAGLVDELTGLFNHRYLVLRLAQEVERAHRYKLPLNLLILDVDFFGRYVSERGEFYGNLVLKKIAELLKKNTRGSDVVVRYGGDAFAIILANTSFEAARALGNRFSAIIKNHPFLYAETLPKGKITVSVGLATLETQTAEELLWCAEKALREAIRHGGDRVEVYQPSAMMV